MASDGSSKRAGKAPESFAQRTVKNTISGTLGGMALCLVGHPFDTLKVRLQTQPMHNPVYSGLVDCFKKTLKWEGVGGLYKGVASPLMGQMFLRATFFVSYFQISSLLAGPGRQDKRLQRHEYFVVGALTGFIGALIESPIDLFKTKMQIQIMRAKSGEPIQYRGVFHAGTVILKNHGIRGMYQGLSATWLRNTPACSFYFGFYEMFREIQTPPGGDVGALPAARLFLSGGAAGFLYWFLCYPADVIKSSMQSDEIHRQRRRYSGIVNCARRLYAEGGWRQFVKGLSPCLLRSVPANAAMWFVVEKSRQIVSSYDL